MLNCETHLIKQIKELTDEKIELDYENENIVLKAGGYEAKGKNQYEALTKLMNEILQDKEQFESYLDTINEAYQTKGV